MKPLDPPLTMYDISFIATQGHHCYVYLSEYISTSITLSCTVCLPLDADAHLAWKLQRTRVSLNRKPKDPQLC